MTNLSQKFVNSPFDAIRRKDEQGEYWLARELMSLLQYVKWQRFEDAINRAKISCKVAGFNPGEHFIHLPGLVSGKGRTGDNYKLSLYACHLIAMNGDVRKEAIALAQSYFSAKVREAEVVIPVQDGEIERLKIELAIAQANAATTGNQVRLIKKTESLVAFHGVPTTLVLLGRSDELIEVEKPTIEVIDEKSKAHFKGQTLKQVAEYVKKRYGIRLKNGGTVAKILKSAEKDNLIAHVPRTVVGEYIPSEHLDEVYKVLSNGSRQMLLGE